jgi:separase
MVRAANDKKSTRFKLNDAIVECVAALPATSREEDLEDLFFFMTEAFQFSGVPVSCDETDVDQVRLYSSSCGREPRLTSLL